MKNDNIEFESSTALNKRFIEACWHGDLDEVKSIALKYKPEPKSNNKFIRIAQSFFNKFQKEKPYLDVHYYDDRCFRYACDGGHLEIVKYLLTSDDLVEKCNIHVEDDYALRITNEHEHFEVVRFLVFDMEINKTDAIEKYICDRKAQYLDDLFKTRDLHKELSAEIISKPTEQRKKLKI